MLDLGFAPAVDRILSAVPARRQTMFFSATLDGVVEKHAERSTHEPGADRGRAARRPDRRGRPPLHDRGARAQARPARRRPRRGARAGARLRPHEARRGPAGPPARAARRPRRGPARRHDPAAASPLAQPFRARPRRHPGGHRRRGPRARRRRHHPRHQLRSAGRRRRATPTASAAPGAPAAAASASPWCCPTSATRSPRSPGPRRCTRRPRPAGCRAPRACSSARAESAAASRAAGTSADRAAARRRCTFQPDTLTTGNGALQVGRPIAADQGRRLARPERDVVVAPADRQHLVVPLRTPLRRTSARSRNAGVVSWPVFVMRDRRLVVGAVAAGRGVGPRPARAAACCRPVRSAYPSGR